MVSVWKGVHAKNLRIVGRRRRPGPWFCGGARSEREPDITGACGQVGLFAYPFRLEHGSALLHQEPTVQQQQQREIRNENG